MKNGVLQWLALMALMLALVALAACGGSSDTPTPTEPTPGAAPRRTRAATAAPGAAPQETQDPLNDSPDKDSNNAKPPPATPDQLNDSPANDSNSGGSQPTPASKAQAGPPMDGGAVVVSGTEWLVADDESQTFVFCKNGDWKNLQGGDTLKMSGTYQEKADSILLTNATDKQVTTYKMGWKPKANVLELNDGKVPIHLQYEKQMDCTA